jgi:hypothetical protein
MWKDRGSITLTALMAMLIFSIYGIAVYGRSVTAYKIQQDELIRIEKAYSKDVDRMYEIADALAE